MAMVMCASNDLTVGAPNGTIPGWDMGSSADRLDVSCLQGQVGEACEAAGLVATGAQEEQRSHVRRRLLFGSRPLSSGGQGFFSLPGLLSFQKLETHILN